jgi:hypothetical protein
MMKLATRNQVERILGYISQQERKCCWSGTPDDADALRLAWWTAWFAAYQDSPLPFDAALRKVLGPRYSTYGHKPPLPRPEPRDGEIDGRNGDQWVRSVLAYIEWRCGDSWRSIRDRNHPDRRFYTDASLTLRQAYFYPPRPPAVTSQIPPRKSVQSEMAAGIQPSRQTALPFFSRQPKGGTR